MQTFKFITSQINKDFNEIKQRLYQLYVKTGYIKDMDGRIILYPSSRGANVIGKINDECNGLIVYSEKFKSSYDGISNADVKVLAVPMPYIRNKNQINDSTIVDSWNENTKIYRCRQGTNATLYYFNDMWRISTTKGLDMNNVVWNGNKTYQTIIEEGLQEYNKDWEVFCASLNNKYSYAIGFYHPEFHVFDPIGRKPDIWINCVTDLEKLETVDSKTLELGVPFLSEDENFADEKIPEIVKQMNHICKTATLHYLEQGTIDLGFIIRGLNGGDVLFESTLQSNINKLYYDSHYNNEIFQTSYSRHNYVLLVNYLSYNKKIFISIFPHFQAIFDDFDKKIKNMTENLRALYQKEKAFIIVKR